jgi:hypothetical protein
MADHIVRGFLRFPATSNCVEKAAAVNKRALFTDAPVASSPRLRGGALSDKEH